MAVQRSFSTYYDLQLGRDVTDRDSLAIEDLFEQSKGAARPVYSPLPPEAFFTVLPPLLNAYEVNKKNYRSCRQALRTQEKILHTEKEVLFSKICF